MTHTKTKAFLFPFGGFMKFKKWFENWDITGLRIKTPILEMDWSPQEADKDAASL